MTPKTAICIISNVPTNSNISRLIRSQTNTIATARDDDQLRTSNTEKINNDPSPSTTATDAPYVTTSTIAASRDEDQSRTSDTEEGIKGATVQKCLGTTEQDQLEIKLE